MTRPMSEEREKLAATLLKTTEQMAMSCSAPQNLWNLHSNACLQAVDALLSTSASERGIAEKGMELIRAINKHDIGKDLRGQAYTDIVGAKNLLADAIHAGALTSKGEGE